MPLASSEVDGRLIVGAREKRDNAGKLLASGVDPSENRKAIKAAKGDLAANSFEVVTREWLEGRKPHVALDQHIKTLARFENDVFPWIGKRPISEIDAPELLTVLRRIDGRGQDTLLIVSEVK